MKIVIYPGSFDPFTMGHLDIVTRALKLFDEIIVAIMPNSAKKTCFTENERLNMVKKSISDIKNAKAEISNDLVAKFAEKKNACAIIKGVRSISDMENELSMALINKTQCPEIETVIIGARPDYIYLSSTVVREIGRYGGYIDEMVPEIIRDDIKKGLRR